MASGTGERPLSSVESEKDLLGLSGINQSITITIPANASRTLTFAVENKAGIILLSTASMQASKHGLYIYGSSNTGNLAYTSILSPSQSGTSVSSSGQVVTITNGASTLIVLIACILGNLPTIGNL